MEQLLNDSLVNFTVTLDYRDYTLKIIKKKIKCIAMPPSVSKLNEVVINNMIDYSNNHSMKVSK